jgi:hypothetical protein
MKNFKEFIKRLSFVVGVTIAWAVGCYLLAQVNVLLVWVVAILTIFGIALGDVFKKRSYYILYALPCEDKVKLHFRIHTTNRGESFSLLSLIKDLEKLHDGQTPTILFWKEI